MKIWDIMIFLMLTISCSEKVTNTQDSVHQTNEGKSLLFVGTYTDKEGHVDGKAEGIYALEFNGENSTLKETNLKIKTTNPSYLYVDSSTKSVYAVNEKVGEGEKVTAFSYSSGQLEFLNSLSAEGGAPCYITKADGYLLTANYVGGNHAVYALASDGSLKALSQSVQNSGKGSLARQESPHAHMIVQNPHTSEMISVDLGTDKLTFFKFQNGKLKMSSELQLSPGSGPRHVDFHPSKDIIYVVNELNGTLDVVKKVDGTYQSVQNITSTRNPNNQEAGCADIHVHPSGEYLFASNRGPFNTISQYRILADGTLDLYGERTSNGKVPRAFTFDPTGRFMLVANQNSNNIAIFLFDQETGQLIDTGNDFTAPTPVCLKFE